MKQVYAVIKYVVANDVAEALRLEKKALVLEVHLQDKYCNENNPNKLEVWPTQ